MGHYYHASGYGITVKPLYYANLDKLKKIAAELTGKNYSHITDLDDFDYEIFSPSFGNIEGIPALFVAYINKMENISLNYLTADDDDIIVLQASYPWQKDCLTKKEQEMTEEKLNQIFAKYQDLLEIPNNKQETADYISAYGYC